jgi:hypothetical protein
MLGVDTYNLPFGALLDLSHNIGSLPTSSHQTLSAIREGTNTEFIQLGNLLSNDDAEKMKNLMIRTMLLARPFVGVITSPTGRVRVGRWRG